MPDGCWSSDEPRLTMGSIQATPLITRLIEPLAATQSDLAERA